MVLVKQKIVLVKTNIMDADLCIFGIKDFCAKQSLDGLPKRSSSKAVLSGAIREE